MQHITMLESPRDLASIIQQHSGALTVPRVADLLGFGRTAIYDLVAAGRIPHFRIGASIRFDPFTLAEWLRGHFVEAAA
ncbi:MAG TPA: helix-turn-helix domain-containing protein [Acidobacteriaceae bacterium]|nr:helix-turn-helix domain-containing protein [Acidobacteriaceae bacterium]